MKRNTINTTLTLALGAAVAATAAAQAADSIAPPGQGPEARRGTVLPAPAPPFRGKIGRTYKNSDSRPDKIPATRAPEGAPNVLVILIDDCGFGQWGTFGGQVPTPNLDRLAKMGLRYTRFHTTALSSPTRAALLTGRNHHSVGTGVITEIGTAYPGYGGQIPRSAAMTSEILRQNGYSTAFFGKNHNVPDWETSVSGPFDRWPGLQGFDDSLTPDQKRVAARLMEAFAGYTAQTDYEFPVGWAWAMNTPFQWGKQIASHLGGTRNPMVIVWPDRIKDRGGIRTQFHHVIDVAPTILEAAKLPEPTEVNGVKQKPIEGVSMAYSFDSPTARSPHRVQYFEMFGNLAIYKDGWIACARHGRLPWTLGTYDFNKDKGVIMLFVNDRKVGEGRLEKTSWGRFSADETFDIGEDSGSPVGAGYVSPYRFTGTIRKVVTDIQPAGLTASDLRKIKDMERKVWLGTQ
ncbi:MAG: sulfatase-like hydrolase/transferase [Nitrospiraceae bacterium]|nr:sulfatase-like hydrolase/transferase [Nitrospiraceae bacterium]